MPNINEMLKERSTKKFSKKTYRPWDLSGDGAIHANAPPIETPQLHSENRKEANAEKTIFSNIQNNTPILSKIELDNKRVSFEQQKDIKKVTEEQHFDNIKITSQISNGEQLDITLDPTSVNHQVMKLSGIQKIILDFVVDFCTIRKSFETGPIETAILSSYSKASTGVVKISIKRLIDKGFIVRNKGKQAKGGYINLSITQIIYDAVIEDRKRTNTICNPVDFINSIRYQIDNNESYISSSIYNKTTTNKKEDLPEEWLNIQYEQLQSIGFSKTQIRQLITISEPSIVQESINHFSFGIEHNPKFKKYEDPLNVLMGVLRKGGGWFEKDYRSPKEIAQQRLFEVKKAEIERRKEMEEEAYKLALSEWQNILSKEDIENIAPTKSGGDITPKAAKLSIYFKEKIWPEKKNEYLI